MSKVETIKKCDDCKKNLKGEVTYYDRNDKKLRCEKCNLSC
jgi:hypothetical protein